MRVFFDTEFIEDGVTVDLVSLGAVDEAGREFYAVSTEFDATRANPWVHANVLPLLPPASDPAWMPRRDIRDSFYQWLTQPGEPIELWAYYGAYDHIALCQLWGRMIDLPTEVPMFTHELMQLWEQAGRPTKPLQPGNQHDALADAHWNRDLFNLCARVMPVAATRSSTP